MNGGGFDVVLLDLGLPDSVGLDTLRRFLSHDNDVPVVVLTGMEAEYLGLEAIRSGAQDYLIKGKVDTENLTRSLKYANERSWLVSKLRESEETYRKLTMTSPDAIILSDLGGATVGGIGVCAGANIGDHHAYFEPIHGSAPALAGQGQANPLAAILAIGLMLNYLGQTKAAARIEQAVEKAFAEKAIVLRPDGSAESGTQAVAEAVLGQLSVVDETTDN